MTILKTLHDTETGEPNRIRYDGNEVELGFKIETMASDDEPHIRTAVLSSMSAPIIDEKDAEAFVDLDEAVHALWLVSNVPAVDRVDAFGEVIHD